MTCSALGHYQILERFGQGWVRVVYEAEDLKLKRTVALMLLNDVPARARLQ